ncbi:MAG: single-stranded-DNA-specific exonuclease RecJ [Clostridia bacterium]|nr:single-stranded-DNA-specific exonuclease RecJ [Clostridia bacterium]
MFKDMWTVAKKYEGTAAADTGTGAFDAVDAAVKAICPDDPQGFLDVGLHKLHDCFLLPDMNAAVDRILDAADRGETIGVFGDYDCDGICSCALLYDFLKKGLGCEVIWRVPERTEGYGLSVKAAEEFAAKNVTLIITVDNGISANNEIDHCNSLGIDIIVTDHHEITRELPNSVANCDPMREDSAYPFNSICGCVVAYKLCEAISLSVGLEGVENYLPLAAIATVADVMDLTDENRSVVRLGLEPADDTMFPGLNVLLSDKMAAKNTKKLTSEFVSFYIAPLINSAGRMGKASLAVELLTAENEKDARLIYEKLQSLKDTSSGLVAKMSADFNADPAKYIINDPSSGFVFVKGENWEEGLLGNFAGFLCEKLNKCVCVLTNCPPDENGEIIYKASVRGIPEIESFKAISSCADILVRFGGHANASGFSVAKKNLKELCDRVDAFSRPYYLALPAVNLKKALIYLPPECITLENAADQNKLEPFGAGNPQPVYITGDIDYMNVTKGTSGNVLRFTFKFKNGYAEGVNFKEVNSFSMIRNSFPLAVVYTLSVNEYMGSRKPQLNVIDIIEGEKAPVNSIAGTYGEAVTRMDSGLFNAFHMTREDLFAVFSALKELGKSFSGYDVANLKLNAMKKGGRTASLFTWFKLKYAIDVFTELGLLEKDPEGSYRFAEIGGKKDLSNSRTYNAIGTKND